MQKLRTVDDHDYYGQVLSPKGADAAAVSSWEDPAGQYELIHLREFDGEGVLLLEYAAAELGGDPPNPKITPIICMPYQIFPKAVAGDLCAQLFRQTRERILGEGSPPSVGQGQTIPFRPRPSTT